MIQRREEGRSFRNVRVELKDGYVFEKRLSMLISSKNDNLSHKQQERSIDAIRVYGWKAIILSSGEFEDEVRYISTCKDQSE